MVAILRARKGENQAARGPMLFSFLLKSDLVDERLRTPGDPSDIKPPTCGEIHKTPDPIPEAPAPPQDRPALSCVSVSFSPLRPKDVPK